MLQNAHLLAKIGADTAENERNFAKNWVAEDRDRIAARAKERPAFAVAPEAMPRPAGRFSQKKKRSQISGLVDYSQL